MRLTALATAFLATLASTAQAQDRTIPLDWSGTYVSASLGVSDNSLSADFPTTTFSLSGSGDAYGVALGYQRQSGRLVYGGEIAAWDVNGSPSSGTRRVDFDNGLRASGRLGVSIGRTSDLWHCRRNQRPYFQSGRPVVARHGLCCRRRCRSAHHALGRSGRRIPAPSIPRPGRQPDAAFQRRGGHKDGRTETYLSVLGLPHPLKHEVSCARPVRHCAPAQGHPAFTSEPPAGKYSGRKDRNTVLVRQHSRRRLRQIIGTRSEVDRPPVRVQHASRASFPTASDAGTRCAPDLLRSSPVADR